MKKIYPAGANTLLFLWFMLNMTGFQIGDRLLVSRSWREDGIFMLIFVVLYILFIYKERIGKYILTLWLFMWFLSQFFSHWSFTIADFGIGSNKIDYYKGTIKLINTTSRYIPDLYHTVEHILILSALIIMIIYCVQSKRKIQ